MRLIIRDEASTASNYVSNYIVERIKAFNPTPSKPFVLGLPTGSSPELIYKNLVQKYKDGEISFKNVITFNMDEYVGLPRSHPESYHTFMYNHFFSHIDIDPGNVNILNGNAPDLEAECLLYEDKIQRAGGIELFLGGIGADGHIAFNEPGSSLKSRTRVKTLAYETIIDNSRFFGGDMGKVPKMALTVGIRTILEAREVVIIITGSRKALALQQSIECAVNHMCTLSSLQLHQHALLVCDSPATLELKVKTVKYFKDIEAIASSSGFTQSLPTSATGQEKRKSVGEELDRTTTTPDTLEPEKILSNGEFLAEPISLVAGMQNMRSPTPEFRPDRMSSRIGMTTGNGFGGHNGGKVNLQNMGAEIAVT